MFGPKSSAHTHTAWEQFKIEAPKDVPAKETFLSFIQALLREIPWRAKLLNGLRQ